MAWIECHTEVPRCVGLEAPVSFHNKEGPVRQELPIGTVNMTGNEVSPCGNHKAKDKCQSDPQMPDPCPRNPMCRLENLRICRGSSAEHLAPYLNFYASTSYHNPIFSVWNVRYARHRLLSIDSIGCFAWFALVRRWQQRDPCQHTLPEENDADGEQVAGMLFIEDSVKVLQFLSRSGR